jgi:hypothetical protein
VRRGALAGSESRDRDLGPKGLQVRVLKLAVTKMDDEEQSEVLLHGELLHAAHHLDAPPHPEVRRFVVVSPSDPFGQARGKRDATRAACASDRVDELFEPWREHRAASRRFGSIGAR